MPENKKPTTSEKKSITIHGDVTGDNVIIGDNNTVNQTFIQKFFNIFKSDAETLEQRNRRILLNHVENAWIKGVLDASLHGAALLDLGIKQDPEAVTKYPWAIQKESTKETLPVGLSMLEIFDSIGMGRSLLILGAPGSGKTTMLLELARGLIARAREDVTQPIPMVFNLASWTEKLSLADWLAQELNNLYSVPRKAAPDWVKGDKLLLLLDGLDEVRQESRAKCVDAINTFRKEHGLTSLAVCSRSQDYADLNAKLSFEGAIEIQPLTQKQITEFFNRFWDETAGIKQALEKDSALREMAETPLFLSIMIMAYRDKRNVAILASGDEKVQRKHLLDAYIERIFEYPRAKSTTSQKQDALHWLSWLAHKMIGNNQIPYLIERMQPSWLDQREQLAKYKWIVGLTFGMFYGLIFGLGGGLSSGLIAGLILGLAGGLIGRLVGWLISRSENNIQTVDALAWNWEGVRFGLIGGLVVGLIVGIGVGPFVGLLIGQKIGLIGGLIAILIVILVFVLISGPVVGLILGLRFGLETKQVNQTTRPGERLFLSTKSFLSAILIIELTFWLGLELIDGGLSGALGIRPSIGPSGASIIGLLGTIAGLAYGGVTLIQHYTLRFILARNNLLPWRLVPFLNHCVDLIFLRRVGGGYIFIHRLLMEHFAEMYVETPTSKGN